MGRKKQVSKDFFITVIIIIVIAFFLAGCLKIKKAENSNDNIVEIKERMFVTQVNDVYLNSEDYIGKTIKLEGVFKNVKSYEGDQYCYVIRYGPGCCGNDGIVGFEIKWDEGNAKPYPKDDSWVESTGVLKQYEVEGYLYLDLISLNVLNKRGAETVVQ